MFKTGSHQLRLGLWDVICGVALLFLVLALTVKFWKWDFDDGFIVYRYVENLIHGSGWVYNVGEAYNASTSALNTIVIALVSLVGVSPAAAAHSIGAVSLFIMGMSLYFIFRKDAPAFFSIGVAAFVVFMMANNFTWGLESNLFYGLLSFYILLEAYGTTSWVLLGLLVLTRPDALLLVALRAILELRAGRMPIASMAKVVATIAPWAIFSLITFGNVFPATLQQKMWQGSSGFWGTGWIFLKGLFGYVRGSAFTHLAGVYWAPVVLSVPLVLVPQGVLFCIYRRRVMLLMFSYVAAVLLAYTVLNVPNYHWYYVGVLFITYIFAGYGVLFVTERISFRIHPFLNGAAVSLICVAAGWMAYVSKVDFFDVRTDVYRQLSEKISADTPSGASVAAAEVGVVGYQTHRPMIDLVGLTTPYGEFITGKNTPSLIERIKPGVIIVHHPLMPHEQAVYGEALFVENYRQHGVVTFPGYSELSYFIREKSSIVDNVAMLFRASTNNLVEKQANIFSVGKDDPWIEFSTEQPLSLKSPTIEIEYSLSGSRIPEGAPVFGRVYLAARGGGYSEDLAVPIVLRGGKNQRARYYIAAPGTAQNKYIVIQRLRFDPIQDMGLVDDTDIEVKSVSLGGLR